MSGRLLGCGASHSCKHAHEFYTFAWLRQ
jgi:hypothetical protein